MRKINPKIDLVFKKKLVTVNLNSKEREYYESEKKVMRDREAVMQTAIENAVDYTKIEIAKGLKADGIPYNIISKNTGLTIEQIEKL